MHVATDIEHGKRRMVSALTARALMFATVQIDSDTLDTLDTLQETLNDAIESNNRILIVRDSDITSNTNNFGSSVGCVILQGFRPPG